MSKLDRTDCYIDGDSPQNTEYVVAAVKKRLGLVNVEYVIVASHSGETALSFARAIQGEVKIICVCGPPQRREWKLQWPVLGPDNRKELERFGVEIVDRAPYALHNSILEEWVDTSSFPEKLVREAFYSFGPGFKVAVEVTLMAVACGLIEPFRDVIAVGGTERGADTAILLRTTYPATMFSRDAEKHLRVREIIAMRRS